MSTSPTPAPPPTNDAGGPQPVTDDTPQEPAAAPAAEQSTVQAIFEQALARSAALQEQSLAVMQRNANAAF